MRNARIPSVEDDLNLRLNLSVVNGWHEQNARYPDRKRIREGDSSLYEILVIACRLPLDEWILEVSKAREQLLIRQINHGSSLVECLKRVVHGVLRPRANERPRGGYSEN